MSAPLEEITKSAVKKRELIQETSGFRGNFFEIVNEETGEVLHLQKDNKSGVLQLAPFDPERWAMEERAKLFRLQAKSRKILSKYLNPRGKPYRVRICLRRVRAISGVQVKRGETARAYYQGLDVCSDVWTCPLCSSRVSAYREKEITALLQNHESDGGTAYMMVLTFPHSRQDNLKKMMGQFSTALRKMKSWTAYKKLMGSFQVSGSVRALEVTWGEANGWHPHTHDLLIREGGDVSNRRLEILEAAILREWQRACISVGLRKPSKKRGVKITRCFTPADYLTKFGRSQRWGAGRELTRANSKDEIAKSNRYSPFDFLRSDDLYYEHLFREFADAFFGSRQLFWSRGLKKRYGIEDISDEEIINQKDETNSIICVIDTISWYKLLKIKDFRLQILEVAEREGKDGVEKLLLKALGPLT